MTDNSAQEGAPSARERFQQREEERGLTQSAEDWNLEKRERNLIFYLRIAVAATSCLMLIFLGYVVTEVIFLKGSEHRDDVISTVPLVAPLVGMTTITIFFLFTVFRGVRKADMTHSAISASRQTGGDPTN